MATVPIPRLEVEARQFAKAMKVLARLDPKTEWAQMDFNGTELLVRLGETEQRIPASGTWPVPMHIRSRYARTLASRPILSNPLPISVEGERLTVGSFTIPCATDIPEEQVSVREHEKRIDEATLILKRLHLSREKVADLVAKGNPEYASLWAVGYEPALDQIAKAWKILAPLGVDPRDIRQAMEDAIRHAFKARGVEGPK